MEVDQVGWASRPPGETHLDILHAQDVPAVVHVLFEVFVLDERERERTCQMSGKPTGTPTATVELFCSCIFVLNDAEGHE